MLRNRHKLLVFFFKETATTEIYTLSLHDALPICQPSGTAWTPQITKDPIDPFPKPGTIDLYGNARRAVMHWRSEEHTSELQSRQYLVCRLLLEKKQKKISKNTDELIDQQYKE